jgi:RNA polymerase sigma-70 factor (ECF subfamily)
MLMNASRFSARVDKEGNILTLKEQDRSLWNKDFMQKGFAYLDKSTPIEDSPPSTITENFKVSVYHIMATISAYHCSAADFASTDWKGILTMYDHLLILNPCPLVKLNRSIAVSKVLGTEAALKELNSVKADPAFASYHLLYSTEAEFYLDMGYLNQAIESLKQAILFSPLAVEKIFLEKKLNRLLKNL